MEDFKNIAEASKKASLELMFETTERKNEALLKIAEKIEENKEKIFAANALDLKEAEELVNSGEITKSTYGRLKLDENKMRDMIQGIKDVAALSDPVGKVLLKRELDEGLTLTKISAPIGVIGVIFEARPDVISQISALAIKSGNAVILKGGKESNNTNTTIFEIIKSALSSLENFNSNCVSLIKSREDVKKMLEYDEYIDLIIPRGSNSLVKFIQNNTKIPVLGHAAGICTIFVDEFAKKDYAENICTDAKIQYPSACNAVETILVHKNYPYKNELKEALVRADVEIVENPENYSTEYGEKKVSLIEVNSVAEAVSHINKYGSGHTDSIITENSENAKKFMASVDSAGVYHNASTRFADGFRYGFGAEVGISTNKTHARGPVGLDGLTIYKYYLEGNGQIVADYASGNKKFHHKDLKI